MDKVHFVVVLEEISRICNNCLLAQRKRVGLITQRSEDRNLGEQGLTFCVQRKSFIIHYLLPCSLTSVKPNQS